MGTRRERVIVEGVDEFTGPLRKMRAEVRGFRDDLNDQSGLPKFRDQMRQTVAESRSFRTEMRNGGSEIDRLSGRVRVLADVLALVGPATLPIGAVAVPALAGVASILGVSTLAAGALIGSLQGVGDALDAVDAYQLEPTAENLERARTALDGLAPGAQALVAAVDDFQPMLTQLRDAGADAWAPGLIAALESAKGLRPELEAIMRTAGEAGGRALADGAESLDSERWADFWDFVDQETSQTVPKIARTVGDLTHGMGELWMSLDPGNDDFIDWLGSVADGFDRWASSPEGREDIRALIDYVRDNGPAVENFATSLANAAAQVVQAVAPLGGPTLAALTGVSDAIAVIADSDLGTPIMAGVVALAALNRALAATEAISRSALGRSSLGQSAGRGLGTNIGTQVASVRGAAGAVRRDLGTIGAAWATAGARTERESARMATASQSLRRNLNTLTRAAAPFAAGAGVAAFLGTGLADEMGLTSTATGALTGALIGGVKGGVAGGLVGAVMDIAAANDEWEDSQRALERGLGSSMDSLTTYLDQVDKAYEQAREQREAETDLGGSIANLFTDPADQLRTTAANYGTLFGGQTRGEGMEEIASQAEETRDRTLTALGELAFGLGDRGVFKSANGMDLLVPDIERLGPAVEELVPFLDQLGISFDDLGNMTPTELADLTGQINGMADGSDSAARRTQALAEVVQMLDSPLRTAEQSASDLQAALDDLLGPGLNLSAATDNWSNSLRDLNEDLASTTRSLTAQNDAGDQNRAAIRERVTDLTTLLEAEARGGAGPERLARMFDRQYAALVRTGAAARLNKRELRGYLRELGFTPAVVETILRQVGIDNAKTNARNLRRAYDQLPPDVQTEIREMGTNITKAKIDDLLAKYKLTEKERKALITLLDLASRKVPGINAALEGIRDREATVTVRTVYETRNAPAKGVPLPGEADGGTIPKSGRSYADRYHYLLADGEEVVSNRHGQADRHRGLLKAINAGVDVRHYWGAGMGTAANGATVGRSPQSLAAHAPRVASVVREVPRGPMRIAGPIEIVGTFDTPMGPSEMAGIAQEIVIQELDAERDFNRHHGG